MKELLRKIEIVKEIDYNHQHTIMTALMKKIGEIKDLYDELYYTMNELQEDEKIDFDEIEYQISMHYEDTINSSDYCLSQLEKQLEEKMPTFENGYDVEKYLNGICYGIELKELWTIHGKKYFSVLEYGPLGDANIYQLYIMDGKLYNENDEDIVKMNLELNGEL